MSHDMFHAQGYHAVSTRQIAAACGVTQPVLYRHFATKQDLYVAMLLDDIARLHERLLMVTRRKVDLTERLRAVVAILPASWVDSSQMFHDIAHELQETQRDEVGHHFLQSVVMPVAALFAEGMEMGCLRTHEQGGLDAFDATFALFRLLDDHSTPFAGERSPLQHAERMLALLLRGLATTADT